MQAGTVLFNLNIFHFTAIPGSTSTLGTLLVTGGQEDLWHQLWHQGSFTDFKEKWSSPKTS